MIERTHPCPSQEGNEERPKFFCRGTFIDREDVNIAIKEIGSFIEESCNNYVEEGYSIEDSNINIKIHTDDFNDVLHCDVIFCMNCEIELRPKGSGSRCPKCSFEMSRHELKKNDEESIAITECLNSGHNEGKWRKPPLAVSGDEAESCIEFTDDNYNGE